MPQSPSQADQLAPGTILNQRYRVKELIGSGGYASVYRAWDLKHNTDRAIKEVGDIDAGVRRQFELEAGLLIKSTHPNIPRGYQLFEERGRLYLVMEFVSGRDLEDLLNESLTQRRRPLDEAQVLELAIEVCGALEEMHDREVPIIHRDIKPANIKITPQSKPILIDFGLAKLQTGGPTRTAAQGVSPGFAPPEQYMAKGRTDARTDIYGLGATVYACLTGKDPPEAPSRLLAQTGAAGQALIPPRQLLKDTGLNVTISEATERVVIKALELSPSSRYQSARAFREDLTTALRQRSRAPQPAPAPALVTVQCPSCRRQTRADAARCQHCGESLRPAANGATANQASAKRAAVQPPAAQSSGKQPAVIAPTTGKQRRASAGPGRAPDSPVRAPERAATPASPARTGKQAAVVAADGRAGASPAAADDRTGKQPAVVADARTGKQPSAVADGRTGKQPAVGAKGAAQVATVGALALNTASVAVPHVQAPATKAKQRARAQAPQVARVDTPLPRSWLHLGGPELSSLGKSALALSAIETCWGVLLLALAIVELATRNSTQKPYFILALIWLGVVVVVSAVGAQVLSRPVFRRGHIGGLRRGLQGFGLTIYALAVHGIAIWGLYVFGTSRPSAPLAITAFVIFAVNVFVAGVLSLFNTLG